MALFKIRLAFTIQDLKWISSEKVLHDDAY